VKSVDWFQQSHRLVRKLDVEIPILPCYRWNSEAANAAGARHYCGEAQPVFSSDRKNLATRSSYSLLASSKPVNRSTGLPPALSAAVHRCRTGRRDIHSLTVATRLRFQK
jgi:hypothetical protein